MRYEEIYIGQKVEIIHTVLEKDIIAFAELTGDRNPLHMDETFAAVTPYKKRVVHGMLCASFISTLIGMELPGAGALWVSQTLNFLMPVWIGDVIRVEAAVTHKSEAQKTIALDVSVFNQKNQRVITGKGIVKVIEIVEVKQMSQERVSGAAIVTGGATGIGAETAFRLSEKGYKIVVNYFSTPADGVVDRIIKAGGEAMAFRADVRDADQVDKMLRAAMDKFGHINVLVNNAAGPIEHHNFESLTWDSIQIQLDMHLKAVFYLCKGVLPGMVERKFGKIVNVLSISTDNVPPPQLFAYIIAKSALHALTKTLAVEYGPKGINVNAVSPGITDTRLISDVPDKVKKISAIQTPLQRIALPDDVARVIAFLASDESSYMTGQSIHVCGGQIML